MKKSSRTGLEDFTIILGDTSMAGLLAQVPRKETLPRLPQWDSSLSSPLQRRVRAGIAPDFPILPKRAPQRFSGLYPVFTHYIDSWGTWQGARAFFTFTPVAL